MNISQLLFRIKIACSRMCSAVETRRQDNPIQRIPFGFIADKLYQAAFASRDSIGRKIIAPDNFVIRFSAGDRAVRKHAEDVLAEELTYDLQKRMQKIRGELCSNKFLVQIETDEELVQGEFYIDCKFSSVMHKKEQQKKVKAYRIKRRDLSATKIPPPGSREIQDGSLLRTLLNNGRSIQETSPEQKVVCSIRVNDKMGERIFVMPEGIYCIGRSKASDIQLDEKDFSVSRKHVELKIEKSGILLKITGNNGGKVNDETLMSGAECFAGAGDMLRIGKSAISFEMKFENHSNYDNDKN